MAINPLSLNTDPQAGPVIFLPGLAATLNAWSGQVSEGINTLEAQQQALASGISYIKTSFVGGTANDLDGIDGNSLNGEELAAVFVGMLPTTLYFVQLNATSGATNNPPWVTAPTLNAGAKRWELAARSIRVWPGEAEPTATDDISSEHVKGDVWLYNGNFWICTDHTTGAAVWSSGGGGGSVPTGTGFRHVTSGAEDAASKLVQNTDVHATAAIIEAKLAFNKDTGHTHDGTGSRKVNHADLNNPGTNTHAQIDTHIAAAAPHPGHATTGDLAAHTAAAAPHSGHEQTANKGAASGYASLNASVLVMENPANATATPTSSKIPIADANGRLDDWIDADILTMMLAG